MNKDFLVTLLQKDIKELGLLTEGFEKMTEFPEPLLRLAMQKAGNVLESLESLGQTSPFELGEIDYQSFAGEQEPNISQGSTDSVEYSENAYPQTESEDEHTYDIPVNVEENLSPTELYEEKEHTLDEAAGKIDEESETTRSERHDTEFPISRNEEFQEEIEVDEIGENEQMLNYEESEVLQTQLSATAKNAQEEKNSGNVTLVESLYNQQGNSLGDTLANQKIEDIRQAMNIGDRFRFQRELFGSNGEVMNKTISYLNQLARFDEAVSFLKSKFGWSDDNPHAEDFMQLVRRRYL
ncbi:MAG: hypothetical protein ACYC2P_12430 [Paludibacteraceae bacterium]